MGSGLFFIAHVAFHAWLRRGKENNRNKKRKTNPTTALGRRWFSLLSCLRIPASLLGITCWLRLLCLDLPSYSYSLLSPLPRLGPSETGEDGLGGQGRPSLSSADALCSFFTSCHYISAYFCLTVSIVIFFLFPCSCPMFEKPSTVVVVFLSSSPSLSFFLFASSLPTAPPSHTQ